MSDRPKPRGSGRVAFISRLATIKAEIAQGDYLLTIYKRHSSSLNITYSAFLKLVTRYAEDAKPVGRRPYRSRRVPTPAVGLTAIAPPVIPYPQGTAHARHESANPRTFEHNPSPRENDHADLIGDGTGIKR